LEVSKKYTIKNTVALLVQTLKASIDLH
jgi:hypothetical protein